MIVQAAGMSPTSRVCLPVTDQAAFLGSWPAGWRRRARTWATASRRSAWPWARTLYAKNAGGWTLMSMAPSMLEGMPADPGAAVCGPLTAEYDLAVQVNVQNVPSRWRQHGARP